MLQEILIGNCFGFSFPLEARRYVRSTSAASRRESRACRTTNISSYMCLPLRPASRIRLQIPGSKAFPHPFVPSPGPARTAALRPQFAFEASTCDFLAFQKSSCFLLAFFSRKTCENQGFGPPKTMPKPSQNAFKIDVPKNIDFFEVFCYSVCIFVILETLKIT